MEKSERTSETWGPRYLFLYALLFCCAPIGLIWLWVDRWHTTKMKLAITGAIAVLFLFVQVRIMQIEEDVRRAEINRSAAVGKNDRWIRDEEGNMHPPGWTPPAPTQEATPRPPVEATEISAGELLSDFLENKVAAEERWNGRTVEVSGIIKDINTDILGTIYVTIGSGGAFSHEGRSVQCYFDDSKRTAVTTLRRSQRIAIRGRVDGLMFNVLLKDCSLVR